MINTFIKIFSVKRSFLFIVLLPTLLYGGYLCLFASTQYQSEFRIQVRSANYSNNGGSLGQMLGLVGVGGQSSSSGYAVIQYLESNDAIESIEKSVKLRERYTNPTIDYFSRFSLNESKEALKRYWAKKLSAHYESTTDTVTVKVTAFSANDARELSSAALTLSEKLLNEMSERARFDTVRLAEKEVSLAKDELDQREKSISIARQQRQVIDTTRQVSDAMTRVARLQSELDQIEAEIAVRSKFLSPNAPSLDLPKAKLLALRNELAAAKSAMINKADSQANSLSETVSIFDQLAFQKVIATKRLEAALIGLQTAQREAVRQHLYMDTIVQPSLAEEPIYPVLYRDMPILFAFLFFSWGLIVLLGATLRDHIRF